MSKLEAEVNNETYAITVGEGEPTAVQLGDKTIEVNSRRVESDVWSLIIDGESYEATIQTVKDKLRVSLRGATWDVTICDPRRRRATASSSNAVEGMQVISSPMPGRVVKVEVAVGDKVEAGQGIVIVEAMKMENELEAEGSGIVKEIKCEAGQAVEDGQTLVIIG